MAEGNTALIDFALRGLRRCWMPVLNRWSHIYHLDGRPDPNQSLARSEVFYTLNVLVGLSRVARVPAWIDVPTIFNRNAKLLTELSVRDYAYGTALWASAELGLELPVSVSLKLRQLLSDPARWQGFHAQDLGMILIGVVAQARHEPKDWQAPARLLFEFLLQKYRSESGLFYDTASGLRRRFASFATQTYLTLASYCYGEFSGDENALEIANVCTRKLIDLQGPNGEWPWFFDAKTGKVLDFYEVYSVHQYGMAPAFLERAETHGVNEARRAMAKGFRWVCGQNQLALPMIVPELGLSIRSQVRKGELNGSRRRASRAVTNAVLGWNTGLIPAEALELRLECRSYELGWILWSFGRRQDFQELTGHPIFSEDWRPQLESKLGANGSSAGASSAASVFGSLQGELAP